MIDSRKRPLPVSFSSSRRRFLRTGLGALAGTMLAERLVAEPYWRAGTAAPISSMAPRARPVRVVGQVRGAGRVLAGVGVSDGSAVIETASDGTFELVTTEAHDFVHLCVPRGYRIPISGAGTARCYAPVAAAADGQMQVSFDLEPLSHDDTAHTVLLLADPQTQTAEEMGWMHARTVPDVQATVAAAGGTEVFGIADGDIMYDDLSLYPSYERAVARIGVPFFQVVGNHDLDHAATDEGSTRTFCSRFGPRNYSFERGAVHYVVLDDVFWHGRGYIGYLSAEALGWLANDLARVEAGRPVIVATHIPALGSDHIRSGNAEPEPGVAILNREELYRLLEPYQAHILTGHTHENEHLFEHGTHEHVCGTVCGAWWSGPICWDGTPSGYGVYEVRGEQVTWRYKATGYPADHQIRAYARGTDPSAPHEMVANVWNWDPEWTVLWYENGERRGEMARRVGLDPLSVQLHEGADRPTHRPWVEPRATAHLFYAPCAAAARDLTVEATDRFGRVYTARVPPGA